MDKELTAEKLIEMFGNVTDFSVSGAKPDRDSFLYTLTAFKNDAGSYEIEIIGFGAPIRLVASSPQIAIIESAKIIKKHTLPPE